MGIFYRWTFLGEMGKLVTIISLTLGENRAMSVKSRIALYEEMERLRKRPLIVYATSQRQGADGHMATDVIPEMCEQVLCLPERNAGVDLLIVSAGGDPMVAWQTISILREKARDIAVLVPYMAYSTATLLALGADEILMHPFGNLGPIDPQITVNRKGPDGKNERLHFSSEDMDALIDFAGEKAHLSDQQYMAEAFRLICSEAGPLSIGFALRSSRLTQQLGVKLLQTRLKADKKDDRKAREIVDRLNRQFFTHGYALGRREAKEIGLNVVYPEADVEDAMWRLWKELETDMKSSEPFNPIAVAAARPQIAPIFTPPPSLELPSNMPPEAVKAVWQNVIANIKGTQYAPFDAVTVPALLESSRRQRMFRNVSRIAAFRASDGAPAVHVTPLESRWGESVNAAD